MRLAGLLCCMALVACGGSGDEDATTGISQPPSPTPTTVADTLPAPTTPPTTTTTTTKAPATTNAPKDTTTKAPTTTTKAPATTTAPKQTKKQRGEPAVFRPDNEPTTNETPSDGSTSQAPTRAGEIHIPQIGLHKVMFDWDATEGLGELDWGPGLWRGLGEPGKTGNAVIGAHRTSRNAEFRHIDELEPGDEFQVVDREGTVFTYVVNRTEIVYPDATWILQQPADASQVTLFACHPLGSTAQRIIVFSDLKTT